MFKTLWTILFGPTFRKDYDAVRRIASAIERNSSMKHIRNDIDEILGAMEFFLALDLLRTWFDEMNCEREEECLPPFTEDRELRAIEKELSELEEEYRDGLEAFQNLGKRKSG